MNWDAIGAIGEVLGALVVIGTLGYLAVQVRQNTAQQKREESISVQRGQNEVIAQLQDPTAARSYAMMAEKGRAANPEDQTRAIVYVIQYINHFQIVYDMHNLGSLDEARYKLWEGFAISMVASTGLREWWDEDGGKLAFTAEIRTLFDRKLTDANNPPVAFNRMWAPFKAESWQH